MYKLFISIVFSCLSCIAALAQNNGNFADSIKKIEFFNNIESYAEALQTALQSEKLLADSNALNIQYFAACGQAANGLGKDSLAIRYFNQALMLDSQWVSSKERNCNTRISIGQHTEKCKSLPTNPYRQ